MKTSGYQVEAGNYAHNWNMEQLAIIVAGVVGIVAGLASLTVWPGIWISFGVIFGGASLGGAGMYLVGAMKGAWESRAPLIQDKSTRAYKCGKKSYCTDFKREFHVPRTSICNSYMSGNGCLKKFLVENIDGKERFIVDPFIPLGVSKSKLIKDTTNYPTYFNRAFNKAKSSYSSRKPSGKQGKSYLNRIFIDSLHVGQMAPEFRTPMKNFYEVKESMRKLIKDKAMIYALDEGVFSSDIGRCDLMKDGTSESFSVPGSASGSSSSFSTGSSNCLTFGGESAVGPECNQSKPQTNEPSKSPTVVSGGACSNGTSPYKVDYLGKTWYFDSQKNASKMSSDINKLKSDLEKFADYAYDFHWVWPRLAQEGMIAYPMPGFISYLELISSTLGNKASINVGNVNDINNNLLSPQLQNMQVTCSKYVEAGGGTPTGTIEGDCDRMMAIRLEGQEIDKTQGNGLLDGLDGTPKGFY